MFCYAGKLVRESDGLAPIGPGSRTCLLFRPDDEITFEETTLSTLASVTLVRTVDLGDTTFTLLVPRVNLLGATSHVIHTVGITTMHRTTIAGLGHGQLTTYHVTRLYGSATQVQF
jgi:hypothetical protein